ncbi:unnamed protein product, partial [Oppiella nova]
NFKQYSGYLDITEGKHYFYWFVESQKDPENAPVVLWLNGGPGCSSLFGNLGENGPFRVNSDGKTLALNPNSWNTVANVIYLESPVSVGFSYKDDKQYDNTDMSTAEDNHLVLEEFFKKYPNYRKNPFYITGESYAGIYIPMLAQQIFSNKSTINLQGIAIGNGAYGADKAPLIFMGDYDFSLGHGLLATESYEKKVEKCCECKTGEALNECDFYHPTNASTCDSVHLEQIDTPNPFNIYDDCGANSAYIRLYNSYYAKKSNKKPISERPNELKCPHNGYPEYLNSPEVRNALHVKDDVKRWVDCNGTYTYGDTDQTPVFKQLLNEYKIGKLVVFNGNFDIVCSHVENQRFIDSLKLDKVGHYGSWETPDGRIGGFVQQYEKNLSFVLVRGAGHMVPYDKPEAALQVLKNVVGIARYRCSLITDNRTTTTLPYGDMGAN